MDLQLLASEVTSIPNVYEPLKEFYESIVQVHEVNTAEDIDRLTKVLQAQQTGVILHLEQISVDSMVSHANVVKPYLDYSKQMDTFV